ncbi:MAG: glycine cleavage system protein GcvH [bacterium]|nr:glycine cleavage system protein GcvH [bacterium]
MNFPEELKYHEKHLWARIEGGETIIGITDYAQSQLGDIVYMELPDEGDEVEQNENFGQVESTKVVTEFTSPLSGKIIEVNYDIVDDPNKLNTDPYGEGWLIKIKLNNQDEVGNLLAASSYANAFKCQDKDDKCCK